MVRVGYIWKSCTHGEGLEEFCLHPADVNSLRNGILIAENIEKPFDVKEIMLFVRCIQSSTLIEGS